MSVQEVIDELRDLGREGYKNVLLKHGAKEPCFGVKIEELKKIQKRVKVDYGLALGLYETGVYDAMYLAGLIADDARMTRKDLEGWVKRACRPIAGTTVPSVAAGNPHGRELALEWIASKEELVAVAGWATLSALVSVNDTLEAEELKRLLQRVKREIGRAPNDVRYQMNAFVIAVGCFVPALTKFAIEIGEAIGPVEVDMGDTACQVPYAPDYIRKVEKRGTIGKKRRSAKC
jgi:hypothetical protein